MAEYLAENNYLFQSSISSSYLYFSNFANKDTSFENALKTTSDEQLNTQELTDGGKNKGNSYTRIVSATVMNSELRTTTGEGGITAFSYQGVMQQFEIRIDVNGDDRKYTAIGTDKDGKPFEKEIDPYNVDPTDADFTEFAALCSYICETENLADETMKFVGDFEVNDIFESMDYLTVFSSEMGKYEKAGMGNLSLENFMPHINKLMETLMGVTMEKFNVSLETIEDEPAELQTKDLGFGFVLSPGSAFGMTATQIINPDSDDVIVRVKMSEASGGETFDVNISEVDPRNATAIEMFAYCQYADSIGKGIAKSNFPSWNTVNRYMDPSGVFEFDSVEQAATKKFNWVEAISESDIYYKRESTGEILGSKDILEMLMESYKKIHEKDDEDGDWRKMTDEEWEKLLARVDADIDDMVERVKEETEAAKEERAKAELEKEAELL
ncbi:hypothetical protein [Pseudobutyrivibrio ruminis]|uniref:Uncharacterized protein n=1 Tax=Pseudobutyrivibrio ruminis DSM 9787 TaxID=1123011 RepID=A0A285SE27_9FIRM|nr:hypothetical protein [Pseudobutyrivibrio ruminis]SOC06157.1 hypothetical protein SAMN02910411_2192 [Pseudobutyrivibrio ruminis DSM 9787]